MSAQPQRPVIMLNDQTAWSLAYLARGGNLEAISSFPLPSEFTEIATQIASQRNGQNAASLLEKMVKERFPDDYKRILKSIFSVSPDSERPTPAMPFMPINGLEILKTSYPEPRWGIPDILPVGLSMLGARPKIGKSWLALQIAHAKASGGCVLNKSVESGRVLYVALEDSPRRLHERMLVQRWNEDHSKHIDFITLEEKGEFKFLHIGGAEQIERAIRTRNYALVVIDTFRRATRGIDSKRPEQFDAALEPLQEAAHATNSVALIVDHTRKNSQSGEDIIEDLIDSTAKTATPDTVWGLYRERGKTGARLQITGKDILETTLALKFDAVTGCWQCEGDVARLITPVQTELVRAIRKLNKRATMTNIAHAVKRPESNVTRELNELLANSFIMRDHAKVYSIFEK